MRGAVSARGAAKAAPEEEPVRRAPSKRVPGGDPMANPSFKAFVDKCVCVAFNISLEAPAVLGFQKLQRQCLPNQVLFCSLWSLEYCICSLSSL